MRDPFKRAGRRMMRRLGKWRNVQIKPPDKDFKSVEAIVADEVADQSIGGKGDASRDLLLRDPFVMLSSADCVNCERQPNQWQLRIDGQVYFITKSYPEGDGLTRAFYSPEPDNEAQSPVGDGNGRTWR